MQAEDQITGFIDKFAPAKRERIRACRARLAARFPDAVQLVYDNYNFFVIGFGPTDRTSDAVFSLACHKNGINLFFLQRGPELPDPAGMLRGSGKVVRHLPVSAPEDLDAPEVTALIEAALAIARIPLDASAGRQVIVKSVSEKQRPRR
ncbi:DUF1801 domain-containing protein [Amycolatopsis jejuensis]|uniref:DUF1801 domain-containing protein n=1 Tax=Amycolatopsis jejuensis TaxID=330084 RepID=UPI00068F15EA|nr:DUF1801 domain-containing protein [Amycolatopsis jejuensis]